MQKVKIDLHQNVTDQIVQSIENGVDGFSMPWQRSGLPLCLPKNVDTDNFYNGVNILNLWACAELKNFTSNEWGTYKQWKSVDAQVRKGEKSSYIIFYKEYEVEPDPDDPEDNGMRRVARASRVFNACQVDGYQAEDLPEMPLLERIAHADSFVTATHAIVRHGGDRAYYSPSSDTIQMPDEVRFFEKDSSVRTESYYSVLLHELTHWTGHEKRRNREMGKRFGDETYAMEELIAELGAAFLCAELGISYEPRQDHACYITNWLEVLKNDKKAIFYAAARASEAVTYLKKLQLSPAKAAA